MPPFGNDNPPPAAPTTPPPADPPGDQSAEIAALQAQLAELQAAQAAPAGDHVGEDTLAAAEPGQIVRYVTSPANGDDPGEHYGLVLDVVDVDAETGGEPVDGQPTRAEIKVARLDVQHNRLVADQVAELIG